MVFSLYEQVNVCLYVVHVGAGEKGGGGGKVVRRLDCKTRSVEGEVIWVGYIEMYGKRSVPKH